MNGENRESLQDFCRQIRCPYTCGEPLANHTTFRIGGPADLFLEPDSEEQICQLLAEAEKRGIELFPFGRGSNLLVGDRGFRGPVLHLGKRFSAVRRQGEQELVCKAGTPLAKLCYQAYQCGLTGLEFAWGIPGSVGGGIYMNAGAYGGELKDVLSWVRYADEKGNLHQEKADRLDLSYRHSIFMEKPLYIIEGCFRLEKGDSKTIRAKMDDFFQRRKTKQPLEYGSAGSTFKRPEGSYASLLIDQCGLKGLRIGDAQVSEKHAGFVVNRGKATCREVQELIRQVQDRVKEQTGYQLDLEVQVIGEP